MVLNFTALGQDFGTVIGLGLFGNEMLVGITLVIAAIMLMMIFRTSFEGMFVVIIGFVLILNKEGGFIDDQVFGAVIITAFFILGTGLIRGLATET